MLFGVIMYSSVLCGRTVKTDGVNLFPSLLGTIVIGSPLFIYDDLKLSEPISIDKDSDQHAPKSAENKIIVDF